MADQADLRQLSPLTAILRVANRRHRAADGMYIAGRRGFLVLLASGVAIQTWALFPSTVESGIYVPLPETSAPSAADVKSAREGVVGSPVKAYGLMAAKLVSSTTTYGLVTSAAPLTAADPSLMSALSRVPVKAKLQVLLTLLVSETDPAKQADLQAKLQALLALPEDVLLQVLQHPDLADFNKMLDAVFLGGSELWWIEFQLDKIDIVPVTETSDRIDISGKPAYVFDSTAAAHKDNGAPSTSGLKSLPSSSSTPQGSLIVVSQPEANASMTTFAAAAPASSSPEIDQISAGAPMVDVVQPQASSPVAFVSAAPSPAPIVPPAPTPAPSPTATPTPAATNAEISNIPIATEPTMSPEIFNTGNKVEPGTKPSEPVANNPAATETATPSTLSPGADVGANANPPSAPSGDTNGGGTSGGAANP